MSKVTILTIFSVALAVGTLFLYRWLFAFVFGADPGWLRFFVR